jgi:hypothetical protein
MNMENKSSPYVLRKIGREHNADMLKILRETPIDSKELKICFDRRPDIFMIPELTSEHVECAGFFKGTELLGFAILSYQNLYVNGLPRTVMYYGNVHVKKKGRRKGFFYKTSDIFLRDTYKDSNIGYAVVMKKNEAAERFIGKHKDEYPNLPASKIIFDLEVMNILITFRKKESIEYSVRRATMMDVNLIVDLIEKEHSKRLFAPVLDKTIFMKNLKRRPNFDICNYYIAEKRGKIVGVCAAWDTGIFKQNIIVRYGRRLKVIKTLHVILACLFKMPQLPEEGEAIRSVTVIEYAAEGRNPDILEALLVKMYNDYRARKYNMLIIGSCAGDPLLNATRKFFAQPVVSSIILFSKDESMLEEGKIDVSLPYIDLVML